MFGNEQLPNEYNWLSNDEAQLAAVHVLLDPDVSLFRNTTTADDGAEKCLFKLYPSIFKTLLLRSECSCDALLYRWIKYLNQNE